MSEQSHSLQVTYRGAPCGTCELTQEGLYLRVRCSCRPVSDEILRLFAPCGKQTVCLGVVVPENGRLTLNKRMPATQLQTELAGDIYLAQQARSDWEPWSGTLEGCELTGAVSRVENGVRVVAVPYEKDAPIACLRLFRDLTPQWMDGRLYLTVNLPN